MSFPGRIISSENSQSCKDNHRNDRQNFSCNSDNIIACCLKSDPSYDVIDARIELKFLKPETHALEEV